MSQALALPGLPGGELVALWQWLVDQMADAVAARLGTNGSATKRLMAIPEAAEYIGRSQDAVRKMITRGVLPVTKLDGKRQVDRAALDKLISDSTHFEG